MKFRKTRKVKAKGYCTEVIWLKGLQTKKKIQPNFFQYAYDISEPTATASSQPTDTKKQS